MSETKYETVSDKLEQAISIGMYGKRTEELDLRQASKHIDLCEKILPYLATTAELYAQDVLDRVKPTCACELIEPCRTQCSCANSVMSGGCMRCASYGSMEQKMYAAKSIARKIHA